MSKVLRIALLGLLIATAFGILPGVATADGLPVLESCKNGTMPGWVLGGSAVLTSGGVDPVGEGWLRLTGVGNNEFGYAYFDTEFHSSYGIVVTFEYMSWGGDGADGIAFFLYDGTTTQSQFQIGDAGGSLGYANGCGAIPGLSNAYVGIGIDEWGNFAAEDAARCHHGYYQTAKLPDSVSIRGSGNGTGDSDPNGYYFQTTTPTLSQGIDIPDIPSTDPRPSQTGDDYRKVYLTISPDKKLTLSIQFGFTNTPTELITDYDLTTGTGMVPLPDTLKLGFAASTGGSTNYHEIRFISVAIPADLEVTKTDGQTNVVPGDPITYEVVATNNGPNDLRLEYSTGAVFTDNVPADITGVTWTAVASPGSVCGAYSGSGNNIQTTLNLLADGNATFTIQGTVSPTISQPLENTATITPPVYISDDNLSDNTATDTDGVFPAVVTNAASGVNDDEATLNGDLTAMGSASPVNVYFEWATDDYYTTHGSTYDQTTTPEAKTATGTFNTPITGLSGATTYHFRAVAAGDGTTYGDDMIFITGTTPPAVTTSAADPVSVNSATLNGDLTDKGTASDVDVYFEYGETISYGLTSATQNRSTTGTFSIPISGLDPYKTYHFRAVAEGDGSAVGGDKEFTTLYTLPTVTTDGYSDLATYSATLEGTLTAMGTASSVTVSFEYGLTISYGSETTPEIMSGTGSYDTPALNLLPDTTYHFRAKAIGHGTTYGSDMTFHTTTDPPEVVTLPATDITFDSARLHGNLTSMGSVVVLDPPDDEIDVTFEWATDAYYTANGNTYDNETSPPWPIVEEDDPKTFSFLLDGLASGTTYHFRAKATGGDHGTGNGTDLTFTTDCYLTVGSTSGGSVTQPGEGTFGPYDASTVVDLLAEPDSGYYFVNWTGDVGTVANVNNASTTITMNDDYSITANFAQTLYDLTTSSSTGGSVTTPGEGTFSYPAASGPSIIATPDSGYYFVNWTGEVTTVADVNAASTTITMNNDYSITANFAQIMYDLTTSSSSGGSVTTPGEGTFSYPAASGPSIIATPDSGYYFVNWTGEVTTVADVNAASTTITMNNDYSITANFAQIMYDLTTSSSSGGSVTTPGEGTFSYPAASGPSIIATPDSGYYFVNWTGEVTTVADVNAASTTITMNDDYSITANFTQIMYDLTTSSSSGGSVTTPGEGTFSYPAASGPSIIATPDSGYYFVNWTGEVTTVADVNAASTTITMNDDYSITANFTQIMYDLTTSSSSGGSVTTPGEGTFSYPAASGPSIIATPDSGYYFVNWTGEVTTVADVNAASTTITMNNDYSITANFTQIMYDLTTSSSSGGSVTTPGEGTFSYPAASGPSIIATPDSGYYFVNWTGEVTTVADVNAASTTITMNDDYSITANFTQIMYDLTTSSSSGGSVTTPGEGTFSYPAASGPSIIATPDAGYYFVNWTGEVTTVADVNAASTTITMNDDYSITANFTQIMYDLTTSSSSGGSVTTPGEGTFSYPAASGPSIIATPDAGYYFVNWTGEVTTVADVNAASTTITMNNDYSITANFTQIMYDLTTSSSSGGSVTTPGEGTFSYPAASGPSIIATPDAGYYFVNWTGEVTTVADVNAASTTITMNNDYSITANFAQIMYDLTTSSSSGGSVTTPGEGTFSYPAASGPSIIATPDSGYYFVNWTGEVTTVADVNAASTTITMNDDYSITANFAQIMYDLTTSSSSGGSVTTPGEGTFSYPAASGPSIIATPDAGYYFVNWTGEVTTVADVNAASTTITMNNDYSITANFTQIMYDLTTSSSSGGSVTTPGEGTFSYPAASGPSIIATPDAGYYFVNWTGEVTTVADVNAASTTITMNNDYSITANFAQIMYDLTTSSSSGGSVTTPGEGTFSYPAASGPSIIATPDSGYYFVNWTGEVTTVADVNAASTTITMNDDYSITANFTQIMYDLTTSSSSGGSVTTPGEGTFSYPAASGPSIIATPDSGYYFVNWTGEVTTVADVNAASTTITMNDDYSITANFAQIMYDLTTSSSSGGSVTTPGEGTFSYPAASGPSIIATPDSGYYFVNWTGEVTTVADVNAASTTITMNDDYSITANFAQIMYDLTTSSSSGGSVTTPGEGTFSYPAASGPSIIATPDSGYYFVNWTGEVTTVADVNAASTTITMNNDYSITANFAQIMYDLTTSSSSGGSVTTPGEGTFSYPAASGPSIIATPDSGYYFVNWTGEVTTVADVNAASTTITMNDDYSITANFAQIMYDLTTSSSSGGSVTTPGEGTFSYPAASGPSIIATPDSGYYFVNWTGEVTTVADVNAASTTITMNNDYSITANFAQIMYDLTTSSSSGGSVTTPGEGTFSYPAASGPSIIATPDSGYYFINWTGEVTTVADVNAASTTITMNNDYSITANFAQIMYDLTTSSSSGGSVTTPGEGTFSYPAASGPSIIATPDSGYYFVNWTGEVTTVADVNAASTTITMNGDYSITANFAQIMYDLTTSSSSGGSVTTPGEGTFSYPAASGPSIIATPDSGYYFINWTGEVTTVADVNAASTTITMNGDYSITANFTQIMYDLTTSSSSGGSVTTPGEGTFSYPAASGPSIIATPDSGYYFVNWTGEVTTVADVNAASTTITMNDDYSITANFAQIMYDLTTSSSSGGSVTTPGEGTFSYPAASGPSIIATPDSGYYFINWTGEVTTVADVNAASTTITMNNDYSITANFTQIMYDLTTSSSSGGSVTTPGEGTFSYPAASGPSIIATPDSGYYFVNWTGEVTTVSKNPDQATYAYGTDVTLTANALITYQVDVSSNPPAGGTVNPGSGQYIGLNTFQASANSITMDSNKSVTATFTVTIPPEVTTNDATDVTANSATLNGTLTSLGTGSSVDVTFEWATHDYYSTHGNTYSNNETNPPWPMISTGPFSFNLPGLSSYTMYHFRAKAVAVGHGTDWGEDLTFTTDPAQPTQPPSVNPIQGALCVILPVDLESAPFNDPDPGDYHTASQWQVKTSTGSYSSPVFDSGTDTSNLTLITLTISELNHDTTYFWHVRHKDSHELWSEWSDEDITPEDEAWFKTSDTPEGTDVNITPDGADINYDLVTEDGCTSVARSNVTPAGHSEPVIPRIGPFTEIKTTADYEETIEVGLPYIGSQGYNELTDIRLFHGEWDGTNWRWEDITTRIDSANNMVYGDVTSFSWFYIGGHWVFYESGVPAFPSIYIGIAAAFGAAILGYFIRRRIIIQN